GERQGKTGLTGPPVFWWTQGGRRLTGFTKAWRIACREAGVPGPDSARLPADGRAESQASRCAAFDRHGDGRAPHGGDLSPPRDRRRGHAGRGRREARRVRGGQSPGQSEGGNRSRPLVTTWFHGGLDGASTPQLWIVSPQWYP